VACSYVIYTTSALTQRKTKKQLDLNKYVDKSVRVKLTGGREVTGVLKGYDQLMNLVLDEAKESIQGV
jgi:U6 snRNA-associated Sm-like protein LSm7